MSTGPTDHRPQPRELRRRHLHERQAVIFGTLGAALVASGLIGLSVWFGALPAPFEVPLKSSTPTSEVIAQPCPPEGALPVAYSEISLNVYNGTTRGGLAAQTASELGARGLVIASQGNDPNGRYAGTTQVRTGTMGLANAYTVVALFPDAVVQLDSRADATVDITLGSAFVAMNAPEDSVLDPAVPLTPPPGCFAADAAPAA